MNRSTKNKPEINGVLLIDKAPEMTSHDVVAIARKRLGIKKIGHCGTLDPMATGLLILVIGRGTKIQDLLMSDEKEYNGTIKLGSTTSTQDAQGEILEEKPVPELSQDDIEHAFALFKGQFKQLPPMVSAIKKSGTPLYKLAREGKTVEREPRPVTVHNYEIKEIRPDSIDFEVVCSKGFYVRTYANDIGEALGCGGHLQRLRRSRSGNFDLTRAISVSQLEDSNIEDILKAIISLPEVSKMRS